jgi:hypothetical protein
MGSWGGIGRSGDYVHGHEVDAGPVKIPCGFWGRYVRNAVKSALKTSTKRRAGRI